jgi:hypothetical protein
MPAQQTSDRFAPRQLGTPDRLHCRTRGTRCRDHTAGAIVAYIGDFKVLMIATLVVIPLLIVFKKPPGGGGEAHTLADG